MFNYAAKLCIIVTDVHEATYASENAKKKIFADDEMILLFRNDCHMCGGFPTAGMSQSCGKQWHLIIFDDEGDNHFILLLFLSNIIAMNIFNDTKMTMAMLCRAKPH